ncbi:hypothetical protein [Dongshaea marina]|uniref:hypothetical protein n=1 Tax=Dongshaea marina TaxID=2047966 RepID=UPI001F2F92DD|nr:hypothetical protein [Dongshaea marina]
MSNFSLKVEITGNRFFNGQLSALFTKLQTTKARQFHSGIEGYQPTPCVRWINSPSPSASLKYWSKTSPTALISTPSKC